MIVEVDQSSPVPAYEQLRGQIARMIGSGVLSPGTRIPSIRQLAADLQLAPGTVAKAYQSLEDDGLVTSRRRHGTIVAGPQTSTSPPKRHERAAAAARSYAATSAQLGVDAATALRLVREALEQQRATPYPEPPIHPAP